MFAPLLFFTTRYFDSSLTVLSLSSLFIDLDEENKSGSIMIEIDANSVHTGSDLFDNVMRSASFFDTQ